MRNIESAIFDSDCSIFRFRKMNSYIFGVVLITAAISASNILEIPKPRADYPAALGVVEEVRDLIVGDEVKIVVALIDENVETAFDIAKLLHQAGTDAELVVREMIGKLNEENLSAAEAETHFNKMVEIFLKNEADIREHFPQLSETAQNVLIAVWEAGNAHAAELLEKLLSLLD